MSNLLVLATGGTLIKPDGSSSWAGSLESGGTATLTTKAFTPQGIEGDAIFRRVYVTVEHETGIALTVVPVLDGRTLAESTRSFSLPATTGVVQRYTFIMPIFRALAARGVSVGARGRTLQLKITCTNPQEDWWIDSVGIVFVPGSTAGRRVYS